jgi:hypothetical protein
MKHLLSNIAELLGSHDGLTPHEFVGTMVTPFLKRLTGISPGATFDSGEEMPGFWHGLFGNGKISEGYLELMGTVLLSVAGMDGHLSQIELQNFKGWCVTLGLDEKRINSIISPAAIESCLNKSAQDVMGHIRKFEETVKISGIKVGSFAPLLIYSSILVTGCDGISAKERAGLTDIFSEINKSGTLPEGIQLNQEMFIEMAYESAELQIFAEVCGSFKGSLQKFDFIQRERAELKAPSPLRKHSIMASISRDTKDEEVNLEGPGQGGVK